jgi:hypothetical protein
MIRFPLAWVFLSLFFFAWAGAASAKALLDGDGIGPRSRQIATALVGASGLAVAVGWGLEGMRLGTAAPGHPLPWATNVGTPLAGMLGVAGGLGLAAAAMTALRNRVRPLVWLGACLVLTVSHLAAFPFGATGAPFRRPNAIGQVARMHGMPERIRGRVLSTGDIRHGYELTDRLPSLLGAEVSFLPWRQRRITRRLKFISMFSSINWPATLHARGFLDAMDVELIAAHRSLTTLFIDHGFHIARRRRSVTLFSNPDRMGHAWVNYAVRTFDTEPKALNYILSSEFKPQEEVVLEEPTRHQYPASTREPVTLPIAERALRGRGTEWDVELPRPGIFVVSESAYPGWEATVNGRSAPWIRANYVLRGVELDAGRHKVRFEYRPASIRWGVALSAAGLVAIAGLLVWGVRRDRAVQVA